MSVLADFWCPDHGMFEAHADGSAVTAPCPWRISHDILCGFPSDWHPSPVHSRVKLGEVIRGKSDERPPESYCMDTRPLADGMPVSEWRAKQHAISHDIAIKKARSKL